MTQATVALNLPIRNDASASPPLYARVDAARTAQNPLLDAARPLLQALANTPGVLESNAVAERRKWLEHEVRIFGKVCAELQLRPAHIQDARYCLCSALDEAAMQKEWGNSVATGVEWSANGLAVTFGLDRQGGDGVYRILTRAMGDAVEHRDLIELIECILDLGFKGRYRFQPDGQNRLALVRQRAQDAIAASGSDSPLHVSLPIAQSNPWTARRAMCVQAPNPLPRWQGDVAREPSTTLGACLWIAIGLLCAGALCLAGDVAYERWLQNRDLEQAMPAPTIDALANNLHDRLKSEIADGTLSLEENVSHTALTLRFNNMFAPGAVAFSEGTRPLITTVGKAIAASTAKAQIVGYTDTLPVVRSTLASNQTLSEQRAKRVMRLLLDAGVPSDRLSTTGKGDADPVADNETPRGRTKNRRVEIIVSEQA